MFCRGSGGMIIATYNLRAGGRDRGHWSTMIDQYRVDLLLVQESCSPHLHFPPSLYPDIENQIVWEIVPGNRWGSGLYARQASVRSIKSPVSPGWVTGAEISAAFLPNGSAAVFSLHAPTSRLNYAAEVHRVLDGLAQLRLGSEIVIGGDFNLTVGRRHSSEESPTAKCDLQIQERLREEFGVVNCWQYCHSEVPLGQTLRWARNPTFPYHCDGLFIPFRWLQRLQSCEILSGEEWANRSDHNPVIASFA